MNTSQPEDGWRDEVWTDSADAINIIIDGPWDTTVRPRPPPIPPYMPRGKRSERVSGAAATEPDDLAKNEGLTQGDEATAGSSDAILVICDGPWDTTVRPRPPHIPPYMPGGKPPEQAPPPKDKPSE